MFLNTIVRPRSLAGRLTLWYCLVSSSLFVLAVALIYLLTANSLLEQVDEDLIGDIEEFNFILGERGLDELWSQLADEAEADGSEQILFRLYGGSGELMRDSDDGHWEDYQLSDRIAQNLASLPLFENVHLEGHEFLARTIYGSLENSNSRYLLQITESLEERANVLETFRVTSLLSLPVLFVFSLLAGWFMSRKSLSVTAR